MHIQLVIKIKLDGKPCRKSARVLDGLEKFDLLGQIDEIIAADERHPLSEGFTFVNKYQVESAPFFIVNEKNYSPRIYIAYYRFMRDIFQISVAQEEEILEIMAQNPELDYI